MYEISCPYNKEVNNYDIRDVPKINSNISYEEFFKNYLIQNKPCIISNISKNWPANNNWVLNGMPNFKYLLESYKNFDGCISNCKERFFNAQKTDLMNFEKYIEYWEEFILSNYPTESPLLYLKDWHLRKECEENFYNIPIYFASDWLNEYFSEKTDDDYMFVYMGPKGTWTPYHVDVFTSYSWSTNICGKKKWILFPPDEELKLKDNLGNLPYDVTKCKNLGNTTHFEVTQNSGDAIFVPSGWHHQVWNLEDTISINHNWINGCNVENMWFSIEDNLRAVKNEISDCRDMDGWLDHSQVVLKASHGIDFKMFYDFLFHIANKRINILKDNLTNGLFGFWRIGRNHAIFDLVQIKKVLNLFVNHEDFDSFNFVDDYIKMTPIDLCRHLDEFLLNS